MKAFHWIRVHQFHALWGYSSNWISRALNCIPKLNVKHDTNFNTKIHFVFHWISHNSIILWFSNWINSARKILLELNPTSIRTELNRIENDSAIKWSRLYGGGCFLSILSLLFYSHVCHVLLQSFSEWTEWCQEIL